jgi:hypothetical protein
MINPFNARKNKVKITTTVHPDFLDWLKEQNIPLAEWIEQQYVAASDPAETADLRHRLRFFAVQTVDLQKELNTLKIRLEMLEQDRPPEKEKVPGPPKRKKFNPGII